MQPDVLVEGEMHFDASGDGEEIVAHAAEQEPALRIVFVLSGLGAGGAEKVVNMLAHHRRAHGDDVHVLAVSANNAASFFAYDKAISVEALGGGTASGAIGTARRIARLRTRLSALSPDLVVSFLTKVNIMVVLASRGLGLRLVLSERNNFSTQAMSPIWRLSRPLAARAAERLVMQTRQATTLLPPALKDKSVIIPNPVTLRRASPAAEGDGTRVVAVGRLDRQKGFDLLIDAFATVTKLDPRLTLTIFGEGPERAALEAQVQRLGLQDRIRLPGTTKSPVEWLDAGDIFVLSSRFEGFPNVLLEAMSAGLATIAFDCPWGPSEIINTPEVGMLVPLGDIAQLTAAIRRLAGDAALRQRLGAAAARAVAARYATSIVLQQWDNVIAPPMTATVRLPTEQVPT
ncbi:glycosyltransferase family 4 protein [Ensifer sp.]|jgi:glycosyltransferase involved in cell wall biosynthesis|uniref:glycosyltransferase family 4 protein n=1 Tax=Ensifer sp. TaxID=1872086 RepID=UPI002E159CD9|nr:glycosyltransferase family 4 protein [Ensifer sp.]